MLRPPQHCDLRPFLPDTWASELEKAMHEIALPVKQDTGGPGSIGFEEMAAVDYHYAQRKALVNKMPWLDYLQCEVIPVLMNLQGFGGLQGDPRASETLIPITDNYGITANLYHGNRKGIEWHRDGADVWLNILLTTQPFTKDTGGCLLLHDGKDVLTLEFPTPGIGNVVLVGDYPHSVSQLARPEDERVVIMFVYTNSERANWREKKYDEHFYPKS